MIWVYSKIVNGVKGFKVMLGGVRFATSHAELLTEFIPANQIIPTTEGILRILTAMAKEQTFKSTFEIFAERNREDNFTIGRRREKTLSLHTVEIDTTAFEELLQRHY
jgi:sulfite reductase (ferredoxin)